MGKISQIITILALPLYIVRLHFGVPSTVLEIALLASVILTSIDFVRAGSPWKKLRTHYDPLILVFVLGGILAVASSVDVFGGLGILKAYIIEPILFFYCLVFTTKKEGLGYIFKSLVLTTLLMAVLGLLQKLTGSFSLAPHEIKQGRISAVYNSANALALFIGPVALFALASVFKPFFKIVNDNLSRITFGIISIFFTVVIIWTRSRGGVIAEFLAALILIYFLVLVLNSYKKFVSKKLFIVIPAVVLIGLLVYLQHFYNTTNFLPPTFGKSYSGEDTLQIRYYIWAGTVRMLQDHPILGAGLNGFKVLYSQYRLPQYQEDFQYPHNLALTFWVEMGVVGLIAFIAIVVESYGLLFRAIRQRKDFLIGLGLLAALSYWMIHGLVDVPYFKNDLSVEFWILMALTEIWSVGKITAKHS